MNSKDSALTAARSEGNRAGYVPPRLPSAPRERKPLLATLAVLLIIGGALGSVLLVIRSSHLVSVVGVDRRVAAGSRVPLSAISEVQVAENSDIHYVLWSQRDQLASLYAATDLVQGSLLVGNMLTPTPPATAGQVLAGLSLKAGQYPAGLREGDLVNAFLVGDDRATGGLPAAVPKLADRSRVVRVNTDDRSAGTVQVTITVPADAAGALAFASAGGKVALVLVPGTARN
ncbi:MAG: hypothetical protein QOD41_5054 [Cryptosporangiaceae bacterium]|nr:hypothetical protein [Cryptosporangiaceae bacterium]